MQAMRRLIWHLLLVAVLVAAVFVSMAAAVVISGSRETGMVSGLFIGLLLGQGAFALRFCAGRMGKRMALALSVFLIASLATYAGNFLGDYLRRAAYGLWAVLIPYVFVTIAAWEWVHFRQTRDGASNLKRR